MVPVPLVQSDRTKWEQDLEAALSVEQEKPLKTKQLQWLHFAVSSEHFLLKLCQ